MGTEEVPNDQDPSAAGDPEVSTALHAVEVPGVRPVLRADEPPGGAATRRRMAVAGGSRTPTVVRLVQRDR